MSHRRFAALMGLAAFSLSACIPDAGPTTSPAPGATAAAVATASPSVEATGTAEASASETSSPTPTPEPSLSLDLPAETDARVVSVTVAPEVDADGGTIAVTVTSGADERIDDLVVRWPAELADTLFLSPFLPSEERIREGGAPLVQPWTKWVIGPGERGEPAGTISLGYGPLLAGARLEIPIFVTRRAPGPVAFDLQILAGNELLTLDDGEPAELRVEIP